MAKIHRTAKGTIVDMDALRMKNGDQKSLGNISMNARGDLLGDNGQVIKRRTQIVQDYYKDNSENVRKVSLKPLGTEDFETPAQAMARLNNTPDVDPSVGRRGRKMVTPKD